MYIQFKRLMVFTQETNSKWSKLGSFKGIARIRNSIIALFFINMYSTCPRFVFENIKFKYWKVFLFILADS